MSIITPQFEIVDRTQESIRYLEHGWPTDLCRWHAHEEYEVHLITETVGTSFVGDYIGHFAPGSLFLTGPSLPHNWVTEQATADQIAVRDMLVQFHDTSLRQTFGAFPELADLQAMLTMAKSGIEFEKFPMARARTLLANVRDSNGSERFFHFIALLTELNRWPDKKELSVTRMSVNISEANQSKINTIVDYVLENYQDQIGLEDAASIANMSATSFSRYFASKTGNRFSDFVNQVRLGHACKMLYETDSQISSICFACGFNSLANFNRQFLKVKGTTPREYRQTARQGLQSETAQHA